MTEGVSVALLEAEYVSAETDFFSVRATTAEKEEEEKEGERRPSDHVTLLLVFEVTLSRVARVA